MFIVLMLFIIAFFAFVIFVLELIQYKNKSNKKEDLYSIIFYFLVSAISFYISYRLYNLISNTVNKRYNQHKIIKKEIPKYFKGNL